MGPSTLWHLPALSGALGDSLDSARPCQFLGSHSRHCSHTGFLAVLEHRELVPVECVVPSASAASLRRPCDSVPSCLEIFTEMPSPL